jgi:hypothetical protein
MQKLRCHSASTGVRARGVSMDHRRRRSKNAVLRTAMSGGDAPEAVASHSSGAQPRRENGKTCVIANEAKQSRFSLALRALDCFVACAPRNDEGAQTRCENEILLSPSRERESIFLSPLRGERSDCAAIRVRGRSRESEPSSYAPSSQPSPRTRGEGVGGGADHPPHCVRSLQTAERFLVPFTLALILQKMPAVGEHCE